MKKLMCSAVLSMLPNLAFSQASDPVCYATMSEAIGKSIKTLKVDRILEFQTAEIMNLPGVVYVLYNGYATTNGTVMRLERVTARDGSEAIIKSEISVVDGKIDTQKFCASHIKQAL